MRNRNRSRGRDIDRGGQMIHLESLEELLGVNGQESATEIRIDEIHSFRGHPFQVRDDERMKELIESIRVNGVLTPVLIRPDKDGGYEMISGHRRLHASKIAGKSTIPAIVRDLQDDDAVIAMVDANIQREELLPSEKAFAYRMKLEAMKRQGARTDLLKTAGGTSTQNGRKFETAEEIARQTGESKNQVRRYIRLTELIPELLEFVDQKRFQFTAAVDASYLEKRVQRWLYEYIRDNGPVRPHQIGILRTAAAEDVLTQQKLISLLNESQPGRVSRDTFTLTEKQVRRYFPKNYSAAKMRSIIQELLENWRVEHDV